MLLSFNEMRRRATKFAHDFKDATRENADTHSFYDAFFEVFGVSRRRVASFEAPVKTLGDRRGRIDLFWKGTLLVEQKSAGRDLKAAYSQALDYFPGLSEDELPRYVLVSDFQTFELHDVERRKSHAFALRDLPSHIELFGFISGYERRVFKDQDPVNIKASELMGQIHDALKDAGYTGSDLEVLLVRLLFCLFADDTGIFEKDQFKFFLEDRTSPDGADLGPKLGHLFQVLDTPPERRARNLDESLAAFPYINGELFRQPLAIAAFDSNIRSMLLAASDFEWSGISPAIFGSLFQSVMDKEKRRGIGAHYTSEQNILKVVHALFLDDLRSELARAKGSPARLRALLDRLASLKFLDPACGCGNFLIIAYREIRRLEIEILEALHSKPGGRQLALDVRDVGRIDVDAFYGIEIEEFPARIAEVAMWLMDHLMNLELSRAFGMYFVRIPLRRSPHIHHGNALRMDWNGVVRAAEVSYVLGNPPFVGHQYRSPEQMADMAAVWGSEGRFGRLDYVSCWYRKAIDYAAANPKALIGFVSTNSITQGEQVSILWPDLWARGANIRFAHRTFQWASDARGKAAVHCVIIGLGLTEPTSRTLFDYDTPRSAPHAVKVKNINGYLIEGPNLALPSRTKPREGFPQMLKGSQPTDGGNLILTESERESLLVAEPGARRWLRKYVGGEELIDGKHRWCLWLKDIDPAELGRLPLVRERVAKVKASRLQSPTKSVQEFALLPTLFTQDRQPDHSYLAVPEVSSEARRFIPMTFLPPTVVASNKLQIIVGATPYHFGVLTSTMHMAWVRHVCGRLESRLSYAPSVYNNFPFPAPTEDQRRAIEEAATALLDARKQFPGRSLADLYDPLAMPPDLVAAHRELDRVVDRAYRPRKFESERERMEFLFDLFQRSEVPLVVSKGPRSRKPAAGRPKNRPSATRDGK